MNRQTLCGLLRSVRTLALGAIATAVTTLWVSTVRASAEYLPVLQEYGYAASDCFACHLTTPGMKGNAEKLFAETLKMRGLVSQNVELMRDVMAELEGLTPPTDSDGDLHPDLVELAEAGDPNDPTIGPGGMVPVEYGCSVSARTAGLTAVGHTNDPWPFVMSALVAVGLLIDRRKRRGHLAN